MFPIIFFHHLFHYRYIAHEHAWNCVNLMPDEDKSTALSMCIACNWLLNWDEDATRPWYNALVSRCGTTDIGMEAIDTGHLPQCGDSETC